MHGIGLVTEFDGAITPTINVHIHTITFKWFIVQTFDFSTHIELARNFPRVPNAHKQKGTICISVSHLPEIA